MARPSDYGTLEQVLEIYAGVWGAAADAEGADYWVNEVDAGTWELEDVASSFFDQERVQNLYEDAEGNPLSGDAFLTALYQNIFKVETPDVAGFTYWQGIMSQLGIMDYTSDSVGNLVMQMIDGMWANEATVATTQMLYQNWISASVAFYDYQTNNGLTPFSELSADDQAIFLAAASDLVDAIDEDSTPDEIGAAVDAATQTIDPTVGVTLELTSGTDVVGPTSDALQTTAGDDTINGVSASLSSANTLNQDDQIDGGDGMDTLAVDMQGSFSGFGDDGGLANVEVVNLSNTGSIARSFDADGIEGVETYNLDASGAAINVSNLGDTGAAVNFSNQSSGSATIGFASGVTDGDADALSIGVNDVGFRVNAAGIEALNIAADGDNEVALGADDAESISVTGSGSLTLTDIGAGAETFDASVATGDVDVDLAAASGMTQIATGSGDDVIRAVSGNDLTVNAEVNGGAGTDKLLLQGAGTSQYVMSGVETVAVGDLDASLIFSASNVSGIEVLQATEDMDQNATFANLSAADLTIELSGENSSEQTLSADHGGGSLVNVVASSDADEDNTESNDIDVVFVNSTSLTVDVSEFSDYQGAITANEASEIQANLDGSLTDATFNLAAATAGVVVAGGEDSSFVINATQMVELQVTADADVDMTGSALTGLESLSVDTDGDFRTGDLGKIATVSIEGTGTADLGDLGGSGIDYDIAIAATGLANGDPAEQGTTNPYALRIAEITTGSGQDISVDASGVLGNVVMRTMDAGGGSGDVTLDLSNVGGTVTARSGDANQSVIVADTVSIDASGVLGGVRFETSFVPGDARRENAIDADEITFVGSTLASNAAGFLVGETATIMGGIDVDNFVVAVNNASGETAVISINAGLGDDEFFVADGDTVGTTGTMLGNARVEIVDFNVGDSTSLLIAQVNTYDLDATAAAADLLDDAGISGATAGNVELVDSTSGSATAIEYNGNTYFVASATGAGANNDETFDDGEFLIELTGVTGLSASQIEGIFA